MLFTTFPLHKPPNEAPLSKTRAEEVVGPLNKLPFAIVALVFLFVNVSVL